MTVKTLSKHFVTRWRQRVGQEPTVSDINRIMVSSVKIRGQQKLFRGDFRGGMEPYKVLADYWCVDHQCILRVDEDRGIAVTVFTSRCGRRAR